MYSVYLIKNYKFIFVKQFSTLLEAENFGKEKILKGGFEYKIFVDI